MSICGVHVKIRKGCDKDINGGDYEETSFGIHREFLSEMTKKFLLESKQGEANRMSNKKKVL